MPHFVLTETDEQLAELVHDLRQPLGTIENSAYYLKLLLSEAGAQVQQQLSLIQEQVDRAARILVDATAQKHRSGI